MRKIKIIALTTMLIVFAGAMVMINSCTKNHIDEGIQKSLIDEESQAITAHILAFKAKMEIYRENPGLKTEEKYSADSAMLELESLLNFNFCYTNIETDKKEFVITEITMPLDVFNKIGDNALSQLYYEEIIDSIQEQMLRVNYPNIKLLLVDLEQTGTNSDGDAIISIGSLIGNEGNIINVTQEDGWWYGFLGGTCEHIYQGELDAAIILEGDIKFIHSPAPPPNMMKRYTIIHTEGPLIPNLPEYRIPNDPLDNYMDYRVYYATNAVNPQITNDTKCISNDIEMPFYFGHYNDFIEDFELLYQLEFVDCIIEGYIHSDQSYIQHKYTIYLGNVWLVPISWVIEDIMTYNN